MKDAFVRDDNAPANVNPDPGASRVLIGMVILIVLPVGGMLLMVSLL